MTNKKGLFSKNDLLLTAGYTDFEKGLMRYARSRTHNIDTVDDLVQNTFLKTWKYIQKGGKIDMMEAFLYHILKALVIDEYRKKKSTSLDFLIEKGFQIEFDETEQHANIFDGKQAIDLIDSLPFLYRNVMRLRYVNDLSIKEISLITGQTRNTVAVQAHRGLEKLREMHAARVAKSTCRSKNILL